jgi:periplasmic protein TonB
MSPLTDRADRMKSGIAVGLIHLAVGYALIVGLAMEPGAGAEEFIRLIEVPLDGPPPAERALPQERASDTMKPENPEGAASPPNKQDTPTQIVAPPAVIPVAPPLPVAKVAGTGDAPRAGAAPVPGPGTGAGGVGNGLGSGLSGDGNGGGGSGGRSARARYLSGGIEPRDYPRLAYAERMQGTTFVRFTVMPNGRVRHCAVTRTSGHRELDAATCPLLERRLRYRPARDTSGRAIAQIVSGQQDWLLAPARPDDEYEAEWVREAR